MNQGNTYYKEVTKIIVNGIEKGLIHIIWYCVPVTNERIQDMDIDILRKLMQEDGIRKRICVIFTKCDQDMPEGTKAAALKQVIMGNVRFSVKSFETSNVKGLELDLLELIRWSAEAIDEDDLRDKFIGFQMADLEQKRDYTGKIIATATEIGAVPFSAAVLLVQVQIAMISEIIVCYGVSNLTQISTAIIIDVIVTNIGKSLVTSILKIISGIGSVIGGGDDYRWSSGALTGAIFLSRKIFQNVLQRNSKRKSNIFKYGLMGVNGLSQEQYANIMLLGRTGAGDSSFINYLIGKAVSKTGTGKLVTQGVDTYEFSSVTGVPLHIFDSKGLEVMDYNKIRKEVFFFVQERCGSETAYDWIHSIFYSINVNARRVEPEEIDFIQSLSEKISQALHIVLTHCESGIEGQEKSTAIVKHNKVKLEYEKIRFYTVNSVETRTGINTVPSFRWELVLDQIFETLWFDIANKVSKEYAKELHDGLENLVYRTVFTACDSAINRINGIRLISDLISDKEDTMKCLQM